MKQKLPTQPLLDQIKTQFYDHKQPEKCFYQDRRMLLYALTWPAKWLDQRKVHFHSEHHDGHDTMVAAAWS